MSDHEEKGLAPIWRKNISNSKPPPDDMRSWYLKMVEDLLKNPQNVMYYVKLIQYIFEQYAEDQGELVILDKGNLYFSQNGKAFTDFGVIVLAVITKHEVYTSNYYFDLLILGKNVEPKIIQLESTELCSYQWIERMGPDYIYEKRAVERLQTLIKVMAKYAPKRDEYQYSGWNAEGKNFYILDEQQIGNDRQNVVNPKDACDHTLKMLDVAPHSLTIPLLAVELLSLVHSRMMAGGTYFKGVCCIVAPTQSFKTTLATLFFDLDNGLEADLNFEATSAAIVRTIGTVRDATVVLDDYKPGSTRAESNDMLQKLSRVIRMCSDDSGGIKKSGAQNSTVSNVAHCMVVVTAEQMQLEVQSTLARLLVLEGNRKSVDVKKLTYFQTNQMKYRQFVEEYILHISEQGVNDYCSELVKRFGQERNTLRKQLHDKNTLVDNRTNDMCVWLYVSYINFLDYAQKVGVIDSEQREERLQEALQIFLSLMQKQAERVSELDDVGMFFKGLRILMETKEVKIEELQPRNNYYIAADSKTAIGFAKKDYIFLKNNIAFQQVVTYYHRFGKNFGSSETVLRKQLWDSGSIISQNEKTCIHRLSVNYETYQCIKFQKEKFYELLKGGKWDDAEGDREVPGDRGIFKNADNLLGR